MEDVATVLTSDTIHVVTFIVTAALIAFLLSKNEKRPLGSMAFIYFASAVSGLAMAGLVTVLGVVADKVTVVEFTNVIIFLVGVIIIVIAGFVGRKFNK